MLVRCALLSSRGLLLCTLQGGRGVRLPALPLQVATSRGGLDAWQLAPQAPSPPLLSTRFLASARSLDVGGHARRLKEAVAVAQAQAVSQALGSGDGQSFANAVAQAQATGSGRPLGCTVPFAVRPACLEWPSGASLVPAQGPPPLACR